jgi:hypothetical protein
MRTLTASLIAFTAVALSTACYQSPTGASGNSVVASVRVSTPVNFLEIGHSIVATVTAFDQYGAPVPLAGAVR